MKETYAPAVTVGSEYNKSTEGNAIINVKRLKTLGLG